VGETISGERVGVDGNGFPSGVGIGPTGKHPARVQAKASREKVRRFIGNSLLSIVMTFLLFGSEKGRILCLPTSRFLPVFQDVY
jgi:hypothetical protein